MLLLVRTRLFDLLAWPVSISLGYRRCLNECWKGGSVVVWKAVTRVEGF